VWETDWFGRALAAKVYIYVNDYCEAMYLIRGTDAKGTLLGCSQCLSKPSLSVEMRTLVLHVSQRAEACSYVAPAHDRVEAS
jgi:hypothetical protein